MSSRIAVKIGGEVILAVIVLTVYTIVAAGELNGIGPKVNCTNRFLCFNNLKCIPRHWLCDGADDCGDNSDEKYCERSKFPLCRENNFTMCNDWSKCIPSAWACDGIPDCEDGSDEICGDKGNTCAEDRFVCFFGQCFHKNWICDGEDDCELDRLDEKYCNINTTVQKCPLDWKPCDNLGRCYPSSLTCDGRAICPDGTDETYCENGFRRWISGTNETERNLVHYLLNKRRRISQATNKWGTDLTRAAIALFLNDPKFFSPSNNTGEEIAYELTLQLMSMLIKKKKIATEDLALFVDALTVSCINPRKFFGVDTVAELRRRVNNSYDVNPFIMLTLCNADVATTEDAEKLRKLFDAHRRPLWTDVQAVVMMALKCIHSKRIATVTQSDFERMAKEIKTKQYENGTIESMKNTALVVQALIATRSLRDDSEDHGIVVKAIKSTLLKMRYGYTDIEGIYYALPIFNFKSLNDISSTHCGTFIKTDLQEKPAELNNEEQIEIQTSVVIGNNMDFSRIWKVKVPSNYSFYQVLENISSSDSDFKIQYITYGGKPYVAGLGSFQNSIQSNFFWYIYANPLSSFDDLVLIEKSPVDIQVNENKELFLWYRSPDASYDISSETASTDAITDATFPIQTTTDASIYTTSMNTETFADTVYPFYMNTETYSDETVNPY